MAAITGFANGRNGGNIAMIGLSGLPTKREKKAECRFVRFRL